VSGSPAKAEVVALPPGRVAVPLRLGLGDALLRLLWLDAEVRQPGRKNRADLVKERLLLLDALNRIPIDLGFDCDGDGLADEGVDTDGDGVGDVAIFAASARTSCCRILPPPPPAKAKPAKAEPAKAKAKAKAKPRRRSTSRRKP
jgi:hypothetical protein